MNQQRIEKQMLHDDRLLDVHDIWRTIQGEGPFAGSPAVFIRLAGCNLQCPMCDTDYTSKRKLLQVSEILARVAEVDTANRLVVITGGEPFRQGIALLCHTLTTNNYTVQIETNGTLFVENIPEDVVIVCSPKAGKLNPKIADRIDAFKYVLHADSIDTRDGLPLNVLENDCVRAARPPQGFAGKIFVQPIDMQDALENTRHLDATVASAMKFGYIFCLQVHKIINME